MTPRAKINHHRMSMLLGLGTNLCRRFGIARSRYGLDVSPGETASPTDILNDSPQCESPWLAKVTAFIAVAVATEVATTKGFGLIAKGVAAYRAYRAAQSTSRVGRWMSKAERIKMERTGRVQESRSGTTHVADPASPDTFGKQAEKGAEYVEFDVPSSSLKPTSEGGVSKIIGPNTTEGKLAARKGNPVPEMPKCTNIKVCGSK